MSWVKIESPKKRGALSIKVSYSIPNKRGGPRLFISIPTILGGQEWEKFDTFDAFWGQEEHAGKLWIECCKDGEFKVRRLKWGMNLMLPGRDDFSKEDREPVACDFDRQGPAFLLSIPDWTAATYRKELAASRSLQALDLDAEKPERLSIAGNILVVDKANVRLTGKEVQVMDRLIKGWGKPVSKEWLHNSLYRDDPDGGADPKIIGVMVHKLREKLKPTSIEIFTHFGTGIQLGMRKARAA